MEHFRTLLIELVERHGGKRQAFAEAIGVSPSTLSHFLIGRKSHPPSTEVCLRIARACDVSPTTVLRAAGRMQIAELIEELYGAAAERRDRFRNVHVAPHEYTFLEQWRKLDESTRRALTLVVERSVTAHVGAKKTAR